jgi:hypothetical protein
MTGRHYEPARVVHKATCPDAPQGFVLRAVAVMQAHPNATLHNCLTPIAVRQNPEVTTEAVTYEPHLYHPSAATQPDAVRPLCRTCRGTHPEELGESAGFLPPPTWTGRL